VDEYAKFESKSKGDWVGFFAFIEKLPHLKNIFISPKREWNGSLRTRFNDDCFYFIHNETGTNEDLRAFARYLNKNKLIKSVALYLAE